MPRSPYKFVDRRERARVALSALVGVPLLTLLFTVSPSTVLRRYTGRDVAVVVGLVCGLVALVAVCVVFAETWRRLAAVEIGPDGVRVHTGHYSRDRRVLVSWSEITAIGVSPCRPAGDPAAAGDAVRDWIGFDRSLGHEQVERYRWLALDGRVRLVIGLAAGSRVQADELATWIGEVHRLAESHGRHPAVGTVGAVARSLERWQDRWSRVPQPVGPHVRVREPVLGRGRLAGPSTLF